jgi:hypothetical protein
VKPALHRRIRQVSRLAVGIGVDPRIGKCNPDSKGTARAVSEATILADRTEGELSDTNSKAAKPHRVLVVGLGTMGMSHARAYQAIDGFELVGLCTRRAAARGDLDKEFPGVPRYESLTEALKVLKPDAV